MTNTMVSEGLDAPPRRGLGCWLYICIEAQYFLTEILVFASNKLVATRLVTPPDTTLELFVWNIWLFPCLLGFLMMLIGNCSMQGL